MSSGWTCPDFLRFSERVDCLPVVHGSGDFAVRVRQALLAGDYTCLAVPLPETWSHAVCDAVRDLPRVSAVVQLPDSDRAHGTFVPVEPCQPVIAGIRVALEERLPIVWADINSASFPHQPKVFPDCYAVKSVSPAAFAAALLPHGSAPEPGSPADARNRRLAFELHRAEIDHKRILFICEITDWVWVREAYNQRAPYPAHEDCNALIHRYSIDERTLTFFLGELPFITALYEQTRATLDADDNLSIDGVKALVLSARDRWRAKKREIGSQAGDWLGPKILQTFLQYVRNLTLLSRRLSPDLYTLALAAKQIGGDGFARTLIEMAGEYRVEFGKTDRTPLFLPDVARFSVKNVALSDRGIVGLDSRLPGQRVSWKSFALRREPLIMDRRRYRLSWNPYEQCSWPPDDDRIESFNTHLREQARAMIGADLARSEKFTSSVMDGLDIRETLRHWHTGDLYVKVMPPARGDVEAVVIFFEVPADPDVYRWRTTWHAEHAGESTLGLYATDFSQDVIGPGIARARFGGLFFLYPPRFIPDLWDDPRLPQTGPLEDRLLAAALLHSRHKHIAVVSPCPLRLSWRTRARRLGKRLIHLPLHRFSAQLIDRLRTVHVLNGKQVRTYASRFILDD